MDELSGGPFHNTVGTNTGSLVQVKNLYGNVQIGDSPTEPLRCRVFLVEPSLPDKFPPSALLRSDYRCVPFRGRHQELVDLTAWCASDDEIGMRLVTGPGGQGKTRLALEMTAWAAERDWMAGRLCTGCDEQTLRELCALQANTLVVLDYAETQPQLLASLLKFASERSAKLGRLRLLLLARSSVEWWRQQRVGANDRIAVLWDDAEYGLPVLFDRAEDRPDAFAEAVCAFAESGGFSAEGLILPKDLTHDRFASALGLHMAALAALLDHQESVSPEKALRDPAGRVLDHERNYWSRAAQAVDLPYNRPRTLQTVMTVVTCCGAIHRDEAIELMGSVPDLIGEHPRILGQYADWVHQLNPGDHWLNPLSPDPLAERLVADALTEQDEMPATLGRAARTQRQQGSLWFVLGRAAERYLVVRQAIPTILAGGGDALWLASATIASYLPRPDLLQPALIRSLDQVEDSSILWNAVENMPLSHRNAELKIATASHALSRYKRTEERNIHAEAAIYAALADALLAATRFEETLESLRIAVDLYRDLVRTEPNRYRDEYLRALSNYAVQLDNCGHYDEARRVCDDVLAEAERYGKVDSHHLNAQIWACRSSIFRHLERPGKAAKAMAIAVNEYRAAARTDPRVRMQLPMMIMSLANRCYDLGWHEEALTTIEESVQMQREREYAYPDPLNPNLAEMLINYSQFLFACNQPQEARSILVEAVHRLLALTENNTPRLPVLWETLGLWAVRLRDCNFNDPIVRNEYEELLAIYDRNDWPTTGLPGMTAAMAMFDYGLKLTEVGGKEAGAQWVKRAVALRRGMLADSTMIMSRHEPTPGQRPR